MSWTQILHYREHKGILAWKNITEEQLETCPFCKIEGKRGSNEIATCLYSWLKQLPQEIEEMSLFSDTCGGQIVTNKW